MILYYEESIPTAFIFVYRPNANLELLAARGALELEGLPAALFLAVLPALPRGERLPVDRADVLLLTAVGPSVPPQLALCPEYPRTHLVIN